MTMTKFVEWPVVESVPCLKGVRYAGHWYQYFTPLYNDACSTSSLWRGYEASNRGCINRAGISCCLTPALDS